MVRHVSAFDILLNTACFFRIDGLFPWVEDENENRMLFWEALTNTSTFNLQQEELLGVPRCDFGRIVNYLLKRMTCSLEDRDISRSFIVNRKNLFCFD